jgi:hypothetical protein
MNPGGDKDMSNLIEMRKDSRRLLKAMRAEVQKIRAEGHPLGFQSETLRSLSSEYEASAKRLNALIDQVGV